MVIAIMCFYWVLAWIYLHTTFAGALFWVITILYSSAFLSAAVAALWCISNRLRHLIRQSYGECLKLTFKKELK